MGEKKEESVGELEPWKMVKLICMIRTYILGGNWARKQKFCLVTVPPLEFGVEEV